MSRDARAAAAAVVAAVCGGQSLNQALPDRLRSCRPADRAFVQQLCYGTLRCAPRLLALLPALLDRPLRDKDRDVQALILVGLYQLDDTRVPDHAAVAATVEASAALRKGWARGFVNAVLRRYLREREQLAGQLSAAAAHAHPEWLYDRLRAQWPAQQPSMVAANNSPPAMTLRVNTQRIARDAYLQSLAAQSIEARAGELCATAVYLAEPRDVHTLPGFAEGWVSVQDEAAQLAAGLLDPQPGERVLDACAAPGGKTCHLRELQPQLADLVAMDIDRDRLARVTENLDRLGLDARLLAGDAAQPPGELARDSFDRILVDAPCSATGVIRRHPDIKLLRRADDIAQFAARQRAILDGLWPLLRPGGRLLYVTCSVLDEENAAVVADFLAHTGDAGVLPLPAVWGEPAGIGRQLLPTPSGCDGLFFACLERRRH